jgi:hypothetical protein
MNIDPLIQAQIDGHLIRRSVLMHIATEPLAVRAWTGVGPFEHAGDTVDVGGGTYLGLGEMQDIPALQQLVNGVASRIELSLSGVDDRLVELADADAPDVRSKAVTLGLQFFDEAWQPLGDTLWIWDGEADVIRTDTVSDPGFGRQRTITLSVGSLTTGRRRPVLSFFTRAQQRRRSDDDAFCDRTALYSADTELPWPP